MAKTKEAPSPCAAVTQQLEQEEEVLRQGGGEAGLARQKRLGRLSARERLKLLFDPNTPFFEVGLWAAHNMYTEWGSVPAAGTVAGVGYVHGRPCMAVANDATVKAGAFFPMTTKKLLRAQRIAYQCQLPLLYLVDSSGVFLPLQDEIFPDEDDFGRIFRNNAVISAAGLPQYAAVMGNCIAGGGYLPVLCDKLLMTEGSGLYLAGPALVKAAIGQVVDTEELGGAKMHASISGTVDFHEPDDPTCLKRLRSLVDLLPSSYTSTPPSLPKAPSDSIYDTICQGGTYDVRDLLTTLVDKDSLQEYKADYAKTLVTAYAKVNGSPLGIIATQRHPVHKEKEGVQIGGVIYADSADKAARFVMDCNQTRIPLLFIQDVMGFMVGREAEQTGIIRSGAKLVSAISNSTVPKITLVVGSSFGAGNYALCGKAYDPTFVLAWPNAKYAVMGGDQAANTLLQVQQRAEERRGKKLSEEEVKAMHEKIRSNYQEKMDIRYGAARGWVDAIIAPRSTRATLHSLMPLLARQQPPHNHHVHTGVFQV